MGLGYGHKSASKAAPRYPLPRALPPHLVVFVIFIRPRPHTRGREMLLRPTIRQEGTDSPT